MEQYIDIDNILFIANHSKPFKDKKCMTILVVLPKYSLYPLTIDDNEK